jgi:spore germination protein YaaH
MSRSFFIVAFLLLCLPGTTHATAKVAPLEISGWIPYWRMATGTTDVLPHLRSFTSVMPFGYIVQDDGTLHDAFNFSATSSTSTANILRAAAKAENVKLVPTVMWSNGPAMHRILRSGPQRRALEDAIANLVKEQGFAGIDIDFENKFAETRPYFSLFLEGLYARMGQKLVYCSIEPRTPPSSAFDVLPEKLNYANDYVAINKYCDRVQLMTYDQGAADLRLNAAANSKPYIPVADLQWVKKVVNFAAQTISKKKIVIGVPTYGYEYDLVPLTQGYRYELNWALNPSYAAILASEFGVTPTRNSAGEMSFVYMPTTTPALAATAAAFPSPHIVWWSDAGAIADKIRLARTLGVRGIAIFKLDGGEDPGLWNVLPKK